MSEDKSSDILSDDKKEVLRESKREVLRERIELLRAKMGEEFENNLQSELPTPGVYDLKYESISNEEDPSYEEFINILMGDVHVPEVKISLAPEEMGANFLRETFPEFFDEGCEFNEQFESNFPEIRKEAIRGLLAKLGFLSGRSVATLSMKECSIALLRKVVLSGVEGFLHARSNLFLDYKFPESFYVALSHPNLPKDVVVDVMKKIGDNGWIKDLIEKSFIQASKSFQKTEMEIAAETVVKERKVRKNDRQIEEQTKRIMGVEENPVSVPVKGVRRLI